VFLHIELAREKPVLQNAVCPPGFRPHFEAFFLSRVKRRTGAVPAIVHIDYRNTAAASDKIINAFRIVSGIRKAVTEKNFPLS
jgi:hypothetical protein